MNSYYEDYIDIWGMIGKNTPNLNGDFDCEFDWIGRDINDHLGIFISFNRGFIPEKVYQSLELYSELMEKIELLPLKITGDKNGEFDLLTNKGLFVYDNQDVHRTKELGQYDLVKRPDYPITMSEANLDKFENIIPRFNLEFRSILQFEELKHKFS